MAKFARRASGSGVPARPKGKEAEDVLSREHPALSEYMTLSKWEDGTERETATLLVLWEEGMWKAQVNDRAQGRAAWWSAWTLTGLLQRVEASLAADEVDWRRKREWGGGKKGK